VVEGQWPVLGDKRAALAPAGKLGDEVGRGRQLDVDPEFLFQAGNRRENFAVVGHELQVHVDAGEAPALEHRAGAAREVDAAGLPSGAAQGLHERAEAWRVYGLAHSAARSKLTRRRMRAF
jgi:hypothetical protein